MDHDFLSLEGRVEVGHDPHAPRVADQKHLGRRPVLAARAERARLELFLGRRIEFAARRTRTFAPRRRDRDVPPAQRISS